MAIMILKYLIIFILMFDLGLCENYKGESFPKKYLVSENVVPNKSDAEYYLRSLDKMLGHFAKFANQTDINRGLGLFYMKVILKRTMIDNKKIIQKEHEKLLRRVILQADNVLSHFFSNVINPLNWEHSLKRDYCFGQVIYNPTPLQATKTLKPCVYDEFCRKVLYIRAPSFSYSLSHRMWNIMLARHLRRCYIRDPDNDAHLMEALCSSMYRETVYLARGGYFDRDVWMEHIALCGLLGYKEFFRRHWFRKVVSWIDEQGCIAENFNYVANRTRYLLETEPENVESILERSREVLADPCCWHPMALSLIVLAHGVRHAVTFSEVNKVKDEL